MMMHGGGGDGTSRYGVVVDVTGSRDAVKRDDMVMK